MRPSTETAQELDFSSGSIPSFRDFPFLYLNPREGAGWRVVRGRGGAGVMEERDALHPGICNVPTECTKLLALGLGVALVVESLWGLQGAPRPSPSREEARK